MRWSKCTQLFYAIGGRRLAKFKKILTDNLNRVGVGRMRLGLDWRGAAAEHVGNGEDSR